MDKWTDRMDALSEEELLAEAEKVEKELGLDHEIKEEPDEIFYLYEEMKKVERLNRELQLNIETQEKKKKESRLKWRPGRNLRRKLGYVCVALVCVFTASIVSHADLNRVLRRMKYASGKNEGISFFTVEGNQVDMDRLEYETRISTMQEEIYQKLRVRVPVFVYKPKEFMILNYNLHENKNYGKIYYQFEKGELCLGVSNKQGDFAGIIVSDGKIISERLINSYDIVISLYEYKNEAGEEYYLADWVYQDGYYQAYFRGEQEELIKILENICY